MELEIDYYSRPEVSNSDLGEIEKYWMPQRQVYDLEQAYKFGNLIDAMITEPHRVNYFTYTVGDTSYCREDFETAKQMKRSFDADPLCQRVLKAASCQTVMIRDMEIECGDFVFTLPVRCKWDLWMPALGWGADIKSTVCTSQKQFVEACRYFQYDRQRAWYMDIAGSQQDMLIGISKANYNIFKLPITRGDDFYNSGKAKYQDLAFKYLYLFGDLSTLTFKNNAA